MQPTPGQWQQHDEQYCPEEIWGALDLDEGKVRGIHICTLEDCPEMQANAKLICAAKDLLAACKAQHEAIDYLMAKLIEVDRSFMPTQSPVWQQMLAGNRAIAKATC